MAALDLTRSRRENPAFNYGFFRPIPLVFLRTAGENAGHASHSTDFGIAEQTEIVGSARKSSANLRKRFAQHAKGTSLATSHRGPWKLIYYEAYLNQEDALGRERYLKSGSGRRFLKAQLRHYLAERASQKTA